MSTTVTLRAPPGSNGATVQTGYGVYIVGNDGSVAVDSRAVSALLGAGFTYFRSGAGHARYTAPLAADLVSIVAAAAAAAGAVVIAAQPDYPRKLQVRLVRTSGDIASGTLTLVGTNAQGQPITEVVSLVTAGASLTIKTANAYAHLTSGTVSALTGTYSYTLGIGAAADLGLPLPPAFQDLAVFKENVDAADETVGTIDGVAGTVSPTTAPNGTHSFDFFFGYSQ
jgi:hypothetical protein